MVLCTLTLIGLPLYFYSTFFFYLGATSSHILLKKVSRDSPSSAALLINTSTCVLADYPLFDEEILKHYVNRSGTEFPCDKNRPPFRVFRFNFTWIGVDFPTGDERVFEGNWTCFAQELYHPYLKDSWNLGAEKVPLGRLNNFAHNLTFEDCAKKEELNVTGRWDSVKVTCRFRNSTVNSTYTRVVMLVQRYPPKVSKR